jgi:hypothetical protein
MAYNDHALTTSATIASIIAATASTTAQAIVA